MAEIGGGILYQLCLPVSWADQALTEFDGFETFHADATDRAKGKIALDSTSNCEQNPENDAK